MVVVLESVIRSKAKFKELVAALLQERYPFPAQLAPSR